MVYCTNCGKPVQPETSFCPNCGTKLLVPNPYPTNPQQTLSIRQTTELTPTEYKSEKVAAILAGLGGLFLLGLGHLYIGKKMRGAGLLISGIVFNASAIAVSSNPGLSLGLWLAIFVLWIWAIWDAYEITKQSNGSLKATGRSAW